MADQTDDAALTWASLLAHWTSLARSAVALPPTAEGSRWKQSIAPLIGLQAVTHALGDIGRLDADERALAIDRAEALIQRHARELHAAWGAEPLDRRLVEIIEDARAALAGAAAWGLEWILTQPLAADHPAELAGALLDSGFAGSLLTPAPGVVIPAGAPAAFLASPRAGSIRPEWVQAVAEFLGSDWPPEPRAGPRQVYRQFDFGRGAPVRDLVAPVAAGVAPGQPLLVWAIVDGALQPVSLPARRPAPAPDIPLVFTETLDDDAPGPAAAP